MEKAARGYIKEGDQNMAEVKWIKIAIDIFNNRKITQIEAMPEGDAIIVIWIKLLCLAGSINDGGQIYLTQEIPYTEPMLATQFDRPLPTVHLALQTFEAFGMIEIEDDILKVSNWERYQNVDALEKMREGNRKRVAKHREKVKAQALEYKQNTDVTLQSITETLPTHYGNDIEEDKNQIKNQSNTTTSPYTGENALRRPVFDLADGSAYAPSDEKVAEWIKAFPQLDVEKCLREAAAKNNAHSGQDMRRRKNALTVEPYIVNWLIVESGQAEKAAKERRRNGFSDMPEHGDEITAAELRERNGNLI